MNCPCEIFRHHEAVSFVDEYDGIMNLRQLLLPMPSSQNDAFFRARQGDAALRAVALILRDQLDERRLACGAVALDDGQVAPNRDLVFHALAGKHDIILPTHSCPFSHTWLPQKSTCPSGFSSTKYKNAEAASSTEMLRMQTFFPLHGEP